MFYKLINDIKEFFENHKQVNDIQVGNVSDINSKNKQFPMIHIMPVNSQLNRFNFKIYSFTLYEQDKENLINSLNDTYLILKDFIAYFRNNSSEYYEINDESISIEPFTAKFDDYTNGWELNVSFIVDYNENSCEIPVS